MATAPVAMGCQNVHALEAMARCLPPKQNAGAYSATPYRAGTVINDRFATTPPTPRPPPGVGQVPHGATAAQACLVSYEVVMEPAGNGKASARADRVTLHAKGLTFLIVEHDMNLVMRLCDPVIVLDHGAKIMEGGPSEVQVDPRVLDAYLGV